MRVVRFDYQGETGFGVVEGGEIRIYSGDMFAAPVPTGTSVPLAAVKLLPPCSGTMYALWNNSRCQIEQLGRETPKESLYFVKPLSSFAAHGDDIRYPTGKTERVVLEGEIGIVIGRSCRDVTPAEAHRYIFGYTVVNDVTAQDVVKRDATFPQYTRGKGFDTFSVFGPWIDTEVDPMALMIESYINGRRCQCYPVTDLVHGPREIVAQMSQSVTLLPGDIIACGTSLGADPIVPGDAVEIRIDGLGTLANRVVDGARPSQRRPAKAAAEA